MFHKCSPTPPPLFFSLVIYLSKEIRLVVRRVSQCPHFRNFISVVKLSTSLCPSEFPGNGIWIWGNCVHLGQFCPRGLLAVSETPGGGVRRCHAACGAKNSRTFSGLQCLQRRDQGTPVWRPYAIPICLSVEVTTQGPLFTALTLSPWSP